MAWIASEPVAASATTCRSLRAVHSCARRLRAVASSSAITTRMAKPRHSSASLRWFAWTSRATLIEHNSPHALWIAPPDRVEHPDLFAVGSTNRTAAQGERPGVQHLHFLRLPGERCLRALEELLPRGDDRLL